MNCGNYRGITLLNVAYKTLSGVLNRKVSRGGAWRIPMRLQTEQDHN